MTLSCEQCVDIVAAAIKISKDIEDQPYGQGVYAIAENNGSSIEYHIDEEGSVSVTRVFVQNQESKKLADLLTDYFNEYVED